LDGTKKQNKPGHRPEEKKKQRVKRNKETGSSRGLSNYLVFSTYQVVII
jgi:hypothetical protein